MIEHRGAAGRRPGASRQGGHDMVLRLIVDCVQGIQPQAVEMKLVDPIAGVGNEELADRAALGAIEVQGMPPTGLATRVGVGRGVGTCVVAHGTEVVVNHVQQHAQAVVVSLVDEEAEIIGRAVEPGRGKQIDAVVAPAEGAGKLGYGHDFDERNAQGGQLRQVTCRGPQCALRREGANVQFVDYLSGERHAGPIAVAPGVGPGVDDLRRAFRAFRLAAGGRIGIGVLPAEPVAVPRAGLTLRHEDGEVAAALSRHGQELWLLQ